MKHLTRTRRRWSSRSRISSSGRGFAKTAIVAVLSVAAAACTKSVDFNSLERADRIEVRTPSDKQLKEINDRVQISTAIAFIKRHQSGWSESALWSSRPGPHAALLPWPRAAGRVRNWT